MEDWKRTNVNLGQGKWDAPATDSVRCDMQRLTALSSLYNEADRLSGESLSSDQGGNQSDCVSWQDAQARELAAQQHNNIEWLDGTDDGQIDAQGIASA